MKIHINRSGQSLGQFYPGEVRSGYQSGRFLAEDLAWQEGMESWQPLGEVIDRLAPAGVEVMPVVLEKAGEPAWEQRKEIGFFVGLGGTIRGVLLEPVQTFANMKRTGGFGSPLLFYVIMGTLATLVGFFYQEVMHLVISKQAAAGTGSEVPESLNMAFAGGSFVGVLIFIPVMIFLFAAGIFVWSGIQHLALMLVGGANRPYETTFRVVCYAGGATMVLSLVPGCGGFIGSIWMLVALIIGLAETHKIGKGKSAVAVFLPTIVCCSILMLGVIAAVTIAGLSMAEFSKIVEEAMKNQGIQ